MRTTYTVNHIFLGVISITMSLPSQYFDILPVSFKILNITSQ